MVSGRFLGCFFCVFWGVFGEALGRFFEPGGSSMGFVGSSWGLLCQPGEGLDFEWIWGTPRDPATKKVEGNPGGLGAQTIILQPVD